VKPEIKQEYKTEVKPEKIDNQTTKTEQVPDWLK
jgi:hypothetical protein